MEGAEGSPGSNDGTRVPKRVVQGSERSALGGIGKLGGKEGSGVGGEGKTETDAEASTNEGADVLGGGLDDGSDDHDGSAEQNGDATAQTIGEVGSEGGSSEGTDGLDAVEETQLWEGGK